MIGVKRILVVTVEGKESPGCYSLLRLLNACPPIVICFKRVLKKSACIAAASSLLSRASAPAAARIGVPGHVVTGEALELGSGPSFRLANPLKDGFRQLALVGRVRKQGITALRD